MVRMTMLSEQSRGAAREQIEVCGFAERGWRRVGGQCSAPLNLLRIDALRYLRPSIIVSRGKKALQTIMGLSFS
jgi:hypothetical protein